MNHKQRHYLNLLGDFLKGLAHFKKQSLTLAEDEAEKLLNKLVGKGKLTQDDAHRLFTEFLQKLKENKRDLQSIIEERVRHVVKIVKLPTRKDLQELERKIDLLNQQLDVYIQKRSVSQKPLSSEEQHDSSTNHRHS